MADLESILGLVTGNLGLGSTSFLGIPDYVPMDHLPFEGEENKPTLEYLAVIKQQLADDPKSSQAIWAKLREIRRTWIWNDVVVYKDVTEYKRDLNEWYYAFIAWRDQIRRAKVKGGVDGLNDLEVWKWDGRLEKAMNTSNMLVQAKILIKKPEEVPWYQSAVVDYLSDDQRHLKSLFAEEADLELRPYWGSYDPAKRKAAEEVLDKREAEAAAKEAEGEKSWLEQIKDVIKNIGMVAVVVVAVILLLSLMS